MSLWSTYGLLGVVAGPAVFILGRSTAQREPLSWYRAARAEWVSMLAASLSLSGVLVYVAWRLAAAAGVVSWLVIMGSLLSFIDWACHRLPHAFVALLLAGGIAHCGLAAFGEPECAGRLLRAVVAALLIFVVAMVLLLASPGGWGAGDVTLSATVAFFLGWFSWWHVVAGPVLAFTLGVFAVAIMRTRNVSVRGLTIPFGPALVFASVCVIVLL